MANAHSTPADRVIRWASMISVIVLAGIAAVISYKHMYQLVLRYGETSWTAALLPVSVDGMISVASMSLLADSRQGRRSGLLPWTLLVLGSAASLAANVAVAEPSAVGRLIAAWPSCALIGAYELLMRQVRNGSRLRIPIASHAASKLPGSCSDGSHTRLHMSLSRLGAASYEAPTTWDNPSNGSHEVQTNRAQTDSTEQEFTQNADQAQADDGGGAERAHPRRGRPASGLQRQAWQWALAHHTPAGDLPSSKAIAERFGRRERWGRLVKQAGATGRLNPTTT